MVGQFVFAFSAHADGRMKSEGITHGEALVVIASPDTTEERSGRIWYYGRLLDGRRVRVVVAVDSPIVVTVHEIWGSRE